MLFSSPIFLFAFLPIVLAVYYGPLRGMRRGQNLFLLLASLFFYGWAQPVFVLVMVGSIILNYLLGLWADFCLTRGKPTAAPVVTAAAANLSLLFVFKYLSFTLANLRSLGLNVPLRDIALPVGISFFTFQALSYVLDVARGDAPCQKNPLHVGLYISFFPQLIAGPIVKYRTVAQQIEDRRESWDSFSRGCYRFLLGLGKKVLLANQLAVIADAAFVADGPGSVSMAWLGSICYTLQIFFDFGGYSDMAIGLGKMFGFQFLENFRYPYLASSPSDFWKRWHISLTTWFREYVYFPLGGNRVPKWKWIRNILIVWLLTGIWHGAGWNFLLWGLYYGVWMLAERLFLGKWLEKLPGAVRHIYTMAVVLIGWALFAVEDMGRLGAYFSSLFGGGGWFSPADGYRLRTYLPTLVILAVGSTPLMGKLWDRLGERTRAVLQPLLVLGALILCTASLVDAGYNPFLYFRF